ncbi:MAG: hydrogenase small subunit [Methanosarcinales archaeon]|nr:MAG: hydrogenase small subunit [Methanosarcinales archaeon]
MGDIEGKSSAELKNLDILKLDRRTFMKTVGALGASAFMGTYAADIAKAIAETDRNIVWLQGAECTGCSVSLLNAEYPDVLQAVTDLKVAIQYHETLMPQQGLFVDGVPVEDAALNANYALEHFLDSGKPFVLVVEGAIPLGPDGTGNYCKIGDESFLHITQKAAEKALITVAAGTCAAYGGIPATPPNPTDAVGLQFLKTTKGGALGAGYVSQAGLPVINIPGCPSHPDWVLLTLTAALLDLIPTDFLDEFQRPKMFFNPDYTIHENCPRRGFYDMGKLDTEYAGGKCLWKLGCRAMLSHADCPTRLWNSGTSMCTQVGGPCIGCVEPTFPEGSLAVEVEGIPALVGVDINTAALTATGAAAVGVGAHALRRIVPSKED